MSDVTMRGICLKTGEKGLAPSSWGGGEELTHTPALNPVSSGKEYGGVLGPGGWPASKAQQLVGEEKNGLGRQEITGGWEAPVIPIYLPGPSRPHIRLPVGLECRTQTGTLRKVHLPSLNCPRPHPPTPPPSLGIQHIKCSVRCQGLG